MFDFNKVFVAMISDHDLQENVAAAVCTCVNCNKEYGEKLLAVNGGNTADVQHNAGGLVGRVDLDFHCPGLSVIALTTDASICTAIGDAFNYQHLFTSQIQSHSNKGDVFIGYSSGKSSSILLSFEDALFSRSA